MVQRLLVIPDQKLQLHQQAEQERRGLFLAPLARGRGSGFSSQAVLACRVEHRGVPAEASFLGLLPSFLKEGERGQQRGKRGPGQAT